MIRLLRSESASVTCRERIESSLLPRSQIGQPMPLTTAGSRQAKPNQAVRRAASQSEILERPGTLAEAAYERVAASLMEGGYVPGDRLAARTLAAQLGVSLTPAREAVLRLVSEGALELRNPRTIVVPTLSSRQFKEIYCIRHALEPTAAKIAADQLTAEDTKALERSLERMTGHYARGDYRQAFRSNREFHFRIYAAAGMPLVLSFIQAAWLRVGPTFRLLYPTIAVPEDAIRIHVEAISAIKAQDPIGLSVAIEKDLRRGEALLSRLISQN
jgi:DNA-binding GntR family transcriptional regulator